MVSAATRVRAVPEKGRANDALVKTVARALGLPRRPVTLERGATSRIKTLRIDGDAEALGASLARLVDGE